MAMAKLLQIRFPGIRQDIYLFYGLFFRLILSENGASLALYRIISSLNGSLFLNPNNGVQHTRALTRPIKLAIH